MPVSNRRNADGIMAEGFGLAEKPFDERSCPEPFFEILRAEETSIMGLRLELEPCVSETCILAFIDAPKLEFRCLASRACLVYLASFLYS